MLLASLAQVKDGLEWTLTTEEERVALAALDSLSEDARYYGSERWTDEANCPRQVHNTVLRATRRYLRNPDGYTVSRAGDETVQWSDRGSESGEATFTEREMKMLRDLGGGRPMLHSAPLMAHGPQRATATGYVPVENGEKPFPYYAGDGPW